jgi:alpha-1,3-rhamnosyl/mannosyltransferase
MPRIAVEAAPERRPLTGVGVYVRELRSALGRLAPERIIFLGVRGDADPPPPPGLAATIFAGGSRYRWLLVRADREIRRLGVALAHYTNAAAPLRSSVPFVLTIQDLSVLRYPHYHPVGRLLTVPLLLAAARVARAVIVPSDATRGEVERLLRVPRGRIAVIPLATSWGTPAEPSSAGGSHRSGGGILSRLGLEPGRYVLAAGTLEPRKNLGRLAGAFARLAADDPGLRLVICGPPGWRDGPTRRLLREGPAARGIVLAGYVPDAELRELTAACGAFAYVSRYEGFGLPILDAMAAGAPVVASATSAMPETAGGAAILVDPRSEPGIAEGIRQAFARRDELVAAGRRRAASWSWDDVARATLGVYDAALAGRPVGELAPAAATSSGRTSAQGSSVGEGSVRESGRQR